MSESTLTIPESCRELGISRALGYKLAAEGKIPTIRLGKRLLVPKVQLQRMLDGQF